MSRLSAIPARLMQRLHAPVYESRVRELLRQIIPALRRGDRVLDVGCGFGALGRRIVDDPNCPADVEIVGLERARRGGELIEVVAYDGETFPFNDHAFDVVILADVLHHEEDPDHLIGECARVGRRRLIIKDHQRKGPLAQWRIAFMDWAANAPYGVPCLYRYNTPQQWRETIQRHDLRIIRSLHSMNLYPPVVNVIFGGALQYLVEIDLSRGE